MEDNLAEAQLSVRPLTTPQEEDLLAFLHESSVLPHYPDSEDYVPFVLKSHYAGRDERGYLTKRKIIWVLCIDESPTGFTVVTEKRGGSIKFGPTVLIPGERGKGFGTAFRLLIEAKYPLARKAYNTLPDYNLAALHYVLRAGYQIEARLRGQFRSSGLEYVVGKLLRPAPLFCLDDLTFRAEAPLSIHNGQHLSTTELATIMIDLLGIYYSEINTELAENILLSARGPISFSSKFKKIFVALRGSQVAGVLIATPKRGGALKCSPLGVRGIDPECMKYLIETSAAEFSARFKRKLFLHVPAHISWMVETVLSLGFAQEGVLRQPYAAGIDMAAFGRLD